MPSRSQGTLGYIVAFAIGLGVLTSGAVFSFWRVTEGEVRRSAQEFAARRAPPPPRRVADTTTLWQPTPDAALADTLFILRSQGEMVAALRLLERWLADNPTDRDRRLLAARVAFEALLPQRGVVHYRRFLTLGSDRVVLREAVRRILAEMAVAPARTSLASLLGLDDDGYPVRLGLVRATADAGDPVLADSLLSPIPPRVRPDVDSLRLVLRRAMRPSIAQAARWVAEYPEEPSYRLDYARALMTESRAFEALPHYLAAMPLDTSLAYREEVADIAVRADSLALARRLLIEVLAADSTRDGALLALARVRARLGDGAGAVRDFERLMARRPDEARFAEARGVLFEVGDPALTQPLLGRLVAFRPDDATLRLRYAQDWERLRDLPAAEVQYDTLLRQVPSSALLLARARVRIGRNRLVEALADAAAAEATDPTADAAFLQAEIHRWRTQRDAARAAYRRAEQRAPGDPRVAAGRRLLRQQRRDALVAEPAFGSTVASTGLTDSDGFAATGVRLDHGLAPLPDETVVLVGVEGRRAGGPRQPVHVGGGGDLGIARTMVGTQWLARAGGVAFGGPAALTAWAEATRRTADRTLRLAVGRQPAYETLRSANVVRGDSLLMGATVVGSVNAIVRTDVDVFAQADHVRLGDGNARTVAVASARWTPGGGPIGVLVTTSGARFASGTARYFSPDLFVTQGIALDWRVQQPRGWSWGARVAPALAWVRESAPGRPPGLATALQGAVTGDATWRRPGLEFGAFAGYGQDRAGAYAAGFGGLRARAAW